MTVSFPYYRFSDYLKETFGEKVYRVPVDAGFSCPNRDGTKGIGGCIYCDSRGSAAPFIRRDRSIREQIEEGVQRVLKRYKARKFIVYFQAFSNTYESPEILEKIYTQAVGLEGVIGVAIATRPDCIDRSRLDVIHRVFQGLQVWMEYGLQTIHTRSLAWMQRGHGVDAFTRAVAMTRAYPFRVCAHIIFGLPGETREMMLETARFLARIGIDDLKIHMLHVLKGTRLARAYEQEPFTLLSMEEYISLVCDALETLPPTVVIQRLTGDAPAENLVAPKWILKKQETLSGIREELIRRGTRQGIFWNKVGKEERDAKTSRFDRSL